MSIVLESDMVGFFRERLEAALQRQGVAASVWTERYLLDLLSGYVSTPGDSALDAPLVHRLAEAMEAPTPRERLRKYKEMGDSALYACGFFGDRLERRGVSRSYVVSMGGRAYVAAADLAGRLSWGSSAGATAEIYPELAEKFDAYARVLDEVRECTALRTPQDIVRLYERWKRTGSRLLAERLEEEGVFPQAGAPGGLVH